MLFLPKSTVRFLVTLCQNCMTSAFHIGSSRIQAPPLSLSLSLSLSPPFHLLLGATAEKGKPPVSYLIFSQDKFSCLLFSRSIYLCSCYHVYTYIMLTITASTVVHTMMTTFTMELDQVRPWPEQHDRLLWPCIIISTYEAMQVFVSVDATMLI